MQADEGRLPARHRHFLQLSPAERLRALAADRRPAQLVRSLPAQEFFLTLAQAREPAAAAPLLRHGSRHQLDFLFDIDSWSSEGFDPRRAGRWLRRMQEVEPAVLARWLLEGDESTVVLVLSRLLRVFKLDPSIDETRWPPEKKLPSLDGVYFLEADRAARGGAFEALWAALALLRSEHPPAYESLLEQVLWIIPAEQEETAWEQRASRLAERGFPEFDEALEIWYPPEVEPSSLARRVDREAPVAAAKSAAGVLPALPEPVSRLAQLLPRLDQQRAERLVHDIARLGNRFAVASLAPLGDPETHRDGFRLALCHVNLGLDLLADAGSDEESLLSCLDQLSPWELCGLGTAAVQKRAARARELTSGWLSRVHLGRERLDAPLQGVLRGLTAGRPSYTAWEERRPFREGGDLETCDELLDTVEALGVFLTRHLELGGEELADLRPLPAGVRDPEEIEWSAVALTATARVALGERPTARPLAPADAARALDRLLPPADGGGAREPAALAAELFRRLDLGPARRFLEGRLLDAFSTLPPGSAPPANRQRALLFA